MTTIDTRMIEDNRTATKIFADLADFPFNYDDIEPLPMLTDWLQGR